MNKKILTKEVLATIPAMVAQGLKTPEIAVLLGCKTSTLKVRCSQEKISLRNGERTSRRPNVRLSLILTEEAMGYFQRAARAAQLSRVDLVTKLLEIIAVDDLINAVIDPDNAIPVKEAA
jgi:hypothetical protein